MTIEKYLQLTDEGINIDDYLLQMFLKQDVNNEKILNKSMKVYGKIIQSINKGLITENDVTGSYVILKDICKDVKEEDWKSILYAKLAALIKKETGKNNLKNPSGKYYLCNRLTFIQKLSQLEKKFGKLNEVLVEKALILHCKEAIKGNNKFMMTLDYYISKSNNGITTSELMNSLDSLEDEEEKIVEKVENTKALF